MTLSKLVQGIGVFLLLLEKGGFVSAKDDKVPHSLELSSESWEQMTTGKSVFVKFYAPWCGHCQELAPHWSRLSNEFMGQKEQHHDGLIAQVNCVDQETWCVHDMGITAFPTLLYGDPVQGGILLQTYDGDKTFESLIEFANDKLRHPTCSSLNLEACDDPQERQQMELYWSLSVEELAEFIQNKEKEIDGHHRDFQAKYKQMQKEYDAQAKEHELYKLSLRRNRDILKGAIRMKMESTS